mgnify:CR=1 FL=1
MALSIRAASSPPDRNVDTPTSLMRWRVTESTSTSRSSSTASSIPATSLKVTSVDFSMKSFAWLFPIAIIPPGDEPRRTLRQRKRRKAMGRSQPRMDGRSVVSFSPV